MKDHQKSREFWPGHFTIKVTVDNYRSTDNQAHIILWRNLQDYQIGALYAELGQAVPDNRYEASQVEDTFTLEEVEMIRRHFAQWPGAELTVEPALKPVSWTLIDENGERYQLTGMSPFGDMYCDFLTLGDVLKGLYGTVTHLVTPDNYCLEWDGTEATISLDPTTGQFQVKSGYEQAIKEIEEKRKETQQRLQEMIDDEQN